MLVVVMYIMMVFAVRLSLSGSGQLALKVLLVVWAPMTAFAGDCV
jgi:hypothetical protein